MTSTYTWIGRSISACFVMACLTAVVVGLAAANHPAAERGATLSATWRLVENFPDNRFTAELTLQNDASESLAAPWTLYFNSSMKLASDSVKSPLTLTQINGDLYALRADKAFPPIGAGQQHVLPLIG